MGEKTKQEYPSQSTDNVVTPATNNETSPTVNSRWPQSNTEHFKTSISAAFISGGLSFTI